MDFWLPVLIGAVAVGFLLLWRREVAGRMRYMLRAKRSQHEAERLAEEKEERAKWRQLSSDITTDLLLAVDGNLRVRYANLTAQHEFGSLPPDTSIISYTESLELENLVQEGIGLGEGEDLERVIRIHDRPYRARLNIVQDGVGIALTDVLDLQRLSRARQDMITNLSHELRTPLTSLKLLADTLRSPTGQAPEVARDLAEKVIIEVDQLHRMAEELLDLSAIESGRMVMRLVPTPLTGLVEATVERLKDQAELREIRFRITVDPELSVLADREQAARAILNILHNAIKYSPEGGEVVMEAAPDEKGRVVLSVLDSGPGIPPNELERVFERFYRTQWAWGTPGTGLGLAIARHILQAHGGQIWADNRPLPARGAVFHLAFQGA
jgi:two-component system phosphate regulon sensor histidine kinase PhoR